MGWSVTRRRVLAVLVAAFTLLAAVNALLWSLYRSEVRTVTRGLDDRLLALGSTAAKWLAAEPSAQPGAQPSAPDATLAALVGENRLEDAYVVDADRRVLAGVRTRGGSTLNLLRIDADRLEAAKRGEASAGPGYSIDQIAVDVAYFPVARAAGPAVLALEAGADYRAPERRVRTTYAIAVALTMLVAVVFATALVLALRALERARLDHGRAERLAGVGQMAAMVAHEVRNPLGVLRGQVELARERLGDNLPPRERERFADMLTEIERLNRLTEEFLGLARDLPLVVEDVDLGALAAGIVDEVQLAAPRAQVQTVISNSPIRARVDPARLRQALLNLVLNAAQVGGDGVHVRVEVAHAGPRARISVIDDGPGIPAELAPTLFEPFVGSRPGGSGLGLAVARRVAERHGGALVLESTPGARGARFSLWLPVA
jgi:signal transduction histidine kinase